MNGETLKAFLSGMWPMLDRFFSWLLAYFQGKAAATRIAEAVNAKAEVEAQKTHETHAQSNAALSDAAAVAKLRAASKRRPSRP